MADEPPDEDTLLRRYPWVVVRFACHFCRRGGDVRLAVLAAKYGADVTMGRLVSRFIAGCEWAPDNPTRKPQKYGMKCGGYCPDLRRGGPPDLPPSLSGLTLIEGGRRDMLPAEPPALERRRRIGEAGDEG